MSRVYNFNPGPSTLPLEVIERVRVDLPDHRGRGMSILEESHRGPAYTEVHQATVALVRELLGLDERHHVLFLGGGATLQFAMVPLNLLAGGGVCDFTLTGAWSEKARADAARVGRVRVVFDGAGDCYTRLPDPAGLRPGDDARYLHLTSNETIGGVQWHDWPDPGGVPLVCDMSSDLLSRRIPLERFGIIYAGAQKNLGPAGVCLVIVREDLLQHCPRDLPAYLSYRSHVDKKGLYNTPPVFGVYVMRLVLDWLRGQGGVDWAARVAEERSGLVYRAVDGSGGFYRCPVPPGNRSKMNVVFRLPDERLEKSFVEEAAREGMVGLKGHRSVGGCRASMYNAMPPEGARALADFMQTFASKNG